VCLSNVCDGLNSLSVLSSESCLVTAEDTPGIPVMATFMYFFGTKSKALLYFAKVKRCAKFFLSRNRQSFLVCMCVLILVILVHHVSKNICILLTYSLLFIVKFGYL